MAKKLVTPEAILEKVKKKIISVRRKQARISVDTDDYERYGEAIDNTVANAIVEQMDELLNLMGVPIPSDPKPREC